jgi:anti-anti-sigma factor
MFNIKILVPADLSFSSGVRDIAQEAANKAGFENKQVNMLRLVVDELFMNAVRYGSDNQSHVFFEAIIEPGKIICAFEDEGKGNTRITAEDLKNIIKKESENVSLNKSHGRGLAQITSTLVQAFEVSNKECGGLRMEFVMDKLNFAKKETSLNQKAKEEKILPTVEELISGEVDLNNMNEISEKIESIFKKHKDIPFRLVLDCSKLGYCNSTFLGSLAQWQSTLEENGGECVIKNPTQSIFEIFDLVGITSICKVTYDKKDDSKKENVGNPADK